MKAALLIQRILPPLWLGMLIAIAIEAQLKFLAPGITRELGLGIGRLVFVAINRFEILIAIVLGIAIFAFACSKKIRVILGLVVVILATQTVWLIPALVVRIDAIVAGNPPPDSPLHMVYIAFEFVKMLLLIVLSVGLNLPAKENTQ